MAGETFQQGKFPGRQRNRFSGYQNAAGSEISLKISEFHDLTGQSSYRLPTASKRATSSSTAKGFVG